MLDCQGLVRSNDVRLTGFVVQWDIPGCDVQAWYYHPSDFCLAGNKVMELLRSVQSGLPLSNLDFAGLAGAFWRSSSVEHMKIRPFELVIFDGRFDDSIICTVRLGYFILERQPLFAVTAAEV